MAARRYGAAVRAPTTPPVVILGSHRSGTSALATRLAACGLFLGARVDSHGESTFFQRLNRRLTSEAGGHWTTPHVVRAALDGIDDLASFAAPLRAQLDGPASAEYWGVARVTGRLPPAWGWKDPRNTYLLDLWAALFPDLRIVSVQRDPRACALSLHRRTTELRTTIAAADGLPTQARALRGRPLLADGWRTTSLRGAVDVALDYRELQVGLADRYRHVHTVEYAHFVEDPVGVLQRASDFSGLAPAAAVVREQAATVAASTTDAHAESVELTDEQRRRLDRLDGRAGSDGR